MSAASGHEPASRPIASTGGGAAGVGLPWLVLAAIVGGAGTWLVLTQHARSTAAAVAPAAASMAAAPASSDAATSASPWPASVETAPAVATAAAQPSRAPAPAADVPSAKVPPGADPADYALDDATLARRARTQFGLDCPRIAERAPRRSGHLDVVCSNGLVLRVYLMGDGPPRIAPGH